MALPPLPDNNTSRLFMDYNDSINNHTLSFRFDGGITGISPAVGWLEEFLQLCIGVLPTNFDVLGLRYQLEGEIVTLPTPLSPYLEGFEGASGQATIGPSNAPRELRWVGRSPLSGRRTSISLYGYTGVTSQQFRYTPGDGGIGNQVIIDKLNENPGFPLAIDGTKPVWYPYVNIQWNSYWETEMRG